VAPQTGLPTQRAKTHRMHHSAQSLHPATRGEGNASIPPPSQDSNVRVDRRGGHNICSTQKGAPGPILLAAPEAKELMLIYIAATNRVISTVMASNDQRKAESTPSSGPCTTSAKFSQSRKNGIPSTKNWCTPCLEALVGSLTTSSSTRYRSFHQPRYSTSFAIAM
jgi:hypothetical protein